MCTEPHSPVRAISRVSESAKFSACRSVRNTTLATRPPSSRFCTSNRSGSRISPRLRCEGCFWSVNGCAAAWCRPCPDPHLPLLPLRNPLRSCPVLPCSSCVVLRVRGGCGEAMEEMWRAGAGRRESRRRAIMGRCRYRCSAQGVNAMSRRSLRLLLIVPPPGGARAGHHVRVDQRRHGTRLHLDEGRRLDPGTLLSPVNDRDDWYSIHLDEGDQLEAVAPWRHGDRLLDHRCSGTGSERSASRTISSSLVLVGGSPGRPRTSCRRATRGRTRSWCTRRTGKAAPGGYTLTWSRTHDPAARLYGMDRYQTAAAISRATFIGLDARHSQGDNYPDALAASGLRRACSTHRCYSRARATCPMTCSSSSSASV